MRLPDPPHDSAREPSPARLRSILDVVNDAVILQGPDGVITYANRRAAELYGRTADEAIGMHISDLVDAGDRRKYRAMVELLERDGEWAGRIVNSASDGHHVHVEVRATLLRDDEGAAVGIFSMATDVTARVDLEARLARAQRLESIGELSGGVAHDFNNVLAVILGVGEQLAEELADDEPLTPATRRELAALADQIVGSALRGARLTDRLLTFARRQTLQPELLDVGELLDGIDDLVRRSLTQAITVVTDTGHERWQVVADPVQLESAIVNLAVNARDAMAHGGTLTFHVDAVHVDHRRGRTVGALTDQGHVGDEDDVAPGDYVRIRVSDTGHGMSDAVRAHAFDPFFTTKSPGRGTGLGLSMVHGFAQQSGGRVEVSRTGPDGTTIELLLPRAGPDHLPSAEQTVRRAADPPGRVGAAVLVVDDEEGIRTQTRRVLERAGYRVEEAHDGPTALVRLDAVEPLDIVITDLVMPGGVDGLDVAAHAHARTIPVLLVSGFATEALGGQAPTLPFLSKPYRRDDLLRTVADLLSTPARE